jgi:Uma2 family endonuclease
VRRYDGQARDAAIAAGSARRVGWLVARRYARFVAYPLDPADFKAAAFLPEISRDLYLGLPEDVCKLIEVVDGWLVRCERPTPSHQGIQVNFVVALRGAVKRADARDSTCHRVVGDIDVLISEAPRFHFRSPDVVVYRCIDEERGRWGDRPYASDCVLVLEIVSADSVTTDIRDKRAEYAAAGIPHYWIVRMTNNNGPAISVERLLLAYDGQYISQELRVRGRDVHAVDTVTPLRLELTWEQLDDGL